MFVFETNKLNNFHIQQKYSLLTQSTVCNERVQDSLKSTPKMSSIISTRQDHRDLLGTDIIIIQYT